VPVRTGEYAFTFLVPLNKLFEYFIYQLILNSSWDREVSVNHESPQKVLANYYDGRSSFPLKPDITVFYGAKALYVLDTKFKNPSNTSGSIDLTATDVYQMVTYAICYNCNDVFLVYPYFRGNTKKIFEQEEGLTKYYVENPDLLGAFDLIYDKEGKPPRYINFKNTLQKIDIPKNLYFLREFSEEHIQAPFIITAKDEEIVDQLFNFFVKTKASEKHVHAAMKRLREMRRLTG
jgi:hypothetical protein